MKTLFLHIFNLATVLLILVASPADSYAAFRTEVQNLPDKDSSTKFSYNGYVSQGWAISRPEHFNVSGQSSNRAGSLARTEIGAYGSYNENPNFDLRGGVKYDPTGTFNTNPHLVFGLADLHNTEGTYGIRIGRVRNFFGFQSSTRENPGTRILDYPPQSIYRESFKTVSSAGDGFQLYASETSMLGLFRAELTIADPILRPQRELVEGFFGYPAKGTYRPRTDLGLRTLNLQWTSPSYRWSAHYTISRLNLNYMPSMPDLVTGPASMDLTLHTAGLRRYFQDLRLTGEVLYVVPTGKVWDILRTDPSATKFQSLGASFDVALYRGDWVYNVGYNVWYNNLYDKKGTGLGQSLGLPPHRFYSHDLSAGARYVSGRWIWRAEIHRVQGTSTLPVSANPALPTTRKGYTFFSTSLTYKF